MKKPTHASSPVHSFLKVAKWPAIGALIGGGVLLVGRLVGPSIANELGANAGEGFARGMAEARDKIASIQRQMNISGWGSRTNAQESALLKQLSLWPGFAGHGVVLQNPEDPYSRWRTAYEVRWFRGYPLPPLPSTLKGSPVKIILVDALPVAQDENS